MTEIFYPPKCGCDLKSFQPPVAAAGDTHKELKLCPLHEALPRMMCILAVLLDCKAFDDYGKLGARWAKAVEEWVEIYKKVH